MFQNESNKSQTSPILETIWRALFPRDVSWVARSLFCILRFQAGCFRHHITRMKVCAHRYVHLYMHMFLCFFSAVLQGYLCCEGYSECRWFWSKLRPNLSKSQMFCKAWFKSLNAWDFAALISWLSRFVQVPWGHSCWCSRTVWSDVKVVRWFSLSSFLR